jgi:hypothetical protein
MPATFQSWYPLERVVDSIRWQPEVDPVTESAADRLLSNTVSHQVGTAVYSTELANPLPIRRWRFDAISDDEKTLYFNFRYRVGGSPIRLFDKWLEARGSEFVNAALYGLGLAPVFDRRRGRIWSMTIELAILPG